MEKALFGEFAPITDEQWREQVLKDLKGQSPESLTWETVENIGVQPYYRTAPSLTIPVRPMGPWLVRQDITVANEAEANAVALDALKRGCTSICFIIDAEVDLHILLKDILIEHIHTDWKTSNANVLSQLVEVIESRGLDAEMVKGSIVSAEPITAFTQYKALLPGYKLLTINPFKTETITEQTAQQLAAANALVAELTDAGTSANTALQHICFDIEVGTDYFFEIARVRVLRALWMIICRQYITDYQEPAFIHATNAKVPSTKDGYYDMIRQTTQALSAVIGGVDSLSLVPHVAETERTQGFQERIARNVQLILQYESHLDRIIDPAAGAWYMESITAQLAEKVWARFVSLTSEG